MLSVFTLWGMRIHLLRVGAISVALAWSTASIRGAENPPHYLDASQPIETRVEDLLSRLTLEEKISIIHADSKFTTAAIPRLGIPRRWLDDGPHGVREDIGPDTWNPAGRTDDFSTAMPAGICLAATWNPELGFSEGEAIGQEARARGKDIMLGPGVNILRTPLCGRNFEYLGEDPFLSGAMCVGYIRGEQSQDISSCVKHFALNNQEFERGTHQCGGGRTRVAGNLSARVQGRRAVGRRVVGDGRLQSVARPALLRERLSAQQDFEGRMGLQRPGDVRLGRRARHARVRAQRPRPRNGHGEEIRRLLSRAAVS